MYSHISKGFTLGHVLTRRALRFCTSIPGRILDYGLALFWLPHYSSYWDNIVLSYGDGTHAGLFEVITGWVGESLGYLIGSVVGMVGGLGAYIADSVIKAHFWIYDNIKNKIDRFAHIVANREFFSNSLSFHQPQNYLSKTWNVSVGTLGSALGALLAAAPKIVESIFPFLGGTSSRFAWKVGCAIGGVLGTVTGIALFPVKHITDRLHAGFNFLRNAIQSFSAFVYAKGNQNLARTIDCISVDNLHSLPFTDKYNEYRRASTTQILFGINTPPVVHALAPAAFAPAATAPPPEMRLRDNLIDPITQEPLVDPVMDRQGHTFSRSSITEWLQRSPTCPLSRHPLQREDLTPNLTVKAILDNAPQL